MCPGLSDLAVELWNQLAHFRELQLNDDGDQFYQLDEFGRHRPDLAERAQAAAQERQNCDLVQALAFARGQARQKENRWRGAKN